MVNESANNTQERPERRKSQRIRACFTVIYKLDKHIEIKMQLGDKEIVAVMIDLSQDGMAILTEENVSAPTLLSISFLLINEFNKKDNQVKPMKMEGEVKYNIELKENAYRIGIVFTKIAEDDKYEIANFVNMTKAWDPSA